MPHTHSHKYTIADQEAVQVLLNKVLSGNGSKWKREKLLDAAAEASRQYKDTQLKERRAFFHGLLTGYAVALKLR